MAKDANSVGTAEIRSEIERTRTELGHTIDAIQDRLSPRRAIRDAKETLADATIGRARRLAHRVGEAVHSSSGSSSVATVLDNARNNPTVTALIGTAISALILAVMTRSRRPGLARSLGGLALSLVLASAARQRTSS